MKSFNLLVFNVIIDIAGFEATIEKNFFLVYCFCSPIITHFLFFDSLNFFLRFNFNFPPGPLAILLYIIFSGCSPRWCNGKESTCQYRKHKRCGFDLWVGKIPWSRKWQPTPIFFPGKFHGRRSLADYSL